MDFLAWWSEPSGRQSRSDLPGRIWLSCCHDSCSTTTDVQNDFVQTRDHHVVLVAELFLHAARMVSCRRASDAGCRLQYQASDHVPRGFGKTHFLVAFHLEANACCFAVGVQQRAGCSGRSASPWGCDRPGCLDWRVCADGDVDAINNGFAGFGINGGMCPLALVLAGQHDDLVAFCEFSSHVTAPPERAR